MEYKRTLYLLSLLHSATEGDKKERIEELFKRAVTSTDEYQKLKKLLQSTSFIGIDGVDKHDECEQTLQRTIADITNPTNNIKHLDLLMHLSPTTSFTPSKPRPRSHWKKLTQLALSSFMPSAAPKTSRKPSSFTAIATKTATFSYSPPQLRRR